MANIAADEPRRSRAYTGPALLSYGFRPFFFLGSIHAGVMVLFWIPIFYGHIQMSSALPPLDWHIHEMLYGYFSAAVVGFLLTAVPNWTGRLPVSGWRLGALAALWLAGRFAISFSGYIGLPLASGIDIAFLLVFIAVIAREIIAGKNYRNLRVLAGVGILATGNIVFLTEVMTQGFANYGIRIGIAAMLSLAMLIGGRVIPSFTRNWLVRENPGRLPVPFNRFDGIAMAGSALALLFWIALPESPVTGALFALAFVLQFIRLARWAGDRTWRDRLVFILHVAYLFVPIGFLLGSLGIFGLVAVSAGIHAWTAGALGLLTLAIMSRASLGHTGRPLRATGVVQVLYAFAIAAAILRICAAIHDSSPLLMMLSATCWIIAFLGFAIAYAPIFLLPSRR